MTSSEAAHAALDRRNAGLSWTLPGGRAFLFVPWSTVLDREGPWATFNALRDFDEAVAAHAAGARPDLPPLPPGAGLYAVPESEMPESGGPR